VTEPRFALISDIHSNIEALEAVFRRIDELKVDEVGCLGDIVGYGADPLQCTMMVRQRCRWSIMGNHDWGLFHDVDDFNPLAREALILTRKRLKPGLLTPRRKTAWTFLRELPHGHEAYGYLFFHGSPRDPIMEYVLKSDGFLEPEKMQAIFAKIDRPTFVGHTHWPGLHGADYRFLQATDDRRTFELPEGPCIMNVGSVGQPRDGDPRASFAVVEGRQVTIHRVPYDIRETQSKIVSAGLHPALANRLESGK